MVVFVTGASSGFGASIARSLAGDGHTVIAAGRRKEKLEALAAEDERFHILPVVLDVCDRGSVARVMAQVESEIDVIDCLINNAGLALGVDPAYQASLDEWVQMVNTNVLGVLYCTHAVLPGMVRRNFGRIINLGSVAGAYPYPGGNVYGATKAFVRQLSLNLRADLTGKNIHVTNIEPGLCGGTEFSITRFHGDAKKAEELYRQTQPLQAEDIAEVVRWLLSLPEHVNINDLSMMPTCQGFGHFNVVRNA
ncbi:MAG: SDR family NAD(P)-dependent oxidoreductase [Acidobacteriaceae bacterium]|nr:SDR family NAD(P)-dependent oxidoreductase [Acidobacteriaceae bacterium]